VETLASTSPLTGTVFSKFASAAKTAAGSRIKAADRAQPRILLFIELSVEK
jgi:acyl-CoA reductase-like NAD-dependent aldehyde dehydrogenase